MITTPTEADQAAAEEAEEATCFYPATPDLPQLMEDAMRGREQEETIAFELAQRYDHAFFGRAF